MNKTILALRNLALRHPDTEEGVACEGTPLERRTVKARKKAFVFLGLKDVMLKLRDSLVEATKLAAKSPGLLRVGTNGWVKIDDGGEVALAVLKKWIDESYALMAKPAPAKKKKKTTTAKKKKRKAQ